MRGLYPLLFEPVFKDYIWGGRNLERLGRTLPPGKVAESWEIAGHPDGMSVVANGPLAGQTLQDLVDHFGLALIGENNRWAFERGKFPLLVKLLDANRDLSVQVHPGDDFALAHEGNELGKTEMWVVLDAAPDAAIIYGMEEAFTPGQFRQILASGDLSSALHRAPVKKGDHVCVPSGTLHAILAGAMIAEIQQNANTTYRVFDWNRVGADGRPRPLHIEKALQVINFDQVRPEIGCLQVLAQTPELTRERLCHNRYFTTERISLSSGAAFDGRCNGETLEIWGVLDGEAAIAGLEMNPVQFVLLPANLGPFQVTAHSTATLLRTYVA